MFFRHLPDETFKRQRIIAGIEHVFRMVQVYLKLARGGLSHCPVGGDQLQLRQFVNIVQHVSKMVKIINRVDLTLRVTHVGARRAGWLQIAVGIAFTVK